MMYQRSEIKHFVSYKVYCSKLLYWVRAQNAQRRGRIQWIIETAWPLKNIYDTIHASSITFKEIYKKFVKENLLKFVKENLS